MRVAYIITESGLFSTDIAHPGHFLQLFLIYLAEPGPDGTGQEPYHIKNYRGILSLYDIIFKKTGHPVLLFSDIVIGILFSENVTYGKKGTISHDRQGDEKA